MPKRGEMLVCLALLSACSATKPQAAPNAVAEPDAAPPDADADSGVVPPELDADSGVVMPPAAIDAGTRQIPLPCAFEPVDPNLTVDNPLCPDGRFLATAVIASEQDLINLRGCQRILGDFAVNSESVRTLHGLESLRVIEGQLEIQVFTCENGTTGCPAFNPLFRSLEGLDGLRCIGKTAMIRSQTTLVLGLPRLLEVGGTLTVGAKNEPTAPGLPGLKRVFGDVFANVPLPALETVYGGIDTPQNAPNLRYLGCAPDEQNYCRDGILGCSRGPVSRSDLEALSKCQIALQSLMISGSEGSDNHIENLQPLRALQQINEGLQIGYTQHLPTLDGLDAVRRVGNLFITENAKLTDLTGLSSLEEVKGELTITNNPMLSNLRGLSALKHAGSLQIDGNKQLPLCEVSWLVKRIQLDVPFVAGLVNGPNRDCPP
jgi:hypothetical protein